MDASRCRARCAELDGPRTEQPAALRAWGARRGRLFCPGTSRGAERGRRPPVLRSPTLPGARLAPPLPPVADPNGGSCTPASSFGDPNLAVSGGEGRARSFPVAETVGAGEVGDRLQGPPGRRRPPTPFSPNLMTQHDLGRRPRLSPAPQGRAPRPRSAGSPTRLSGPPPLPFPSGVPSPTSPPFPASQGTSFLFSN